MTSTGYYTPRDISVATGLNGSLVRRYLQSLQPGRDFKAHHQLSEGQYLAAISELQAAKAKCPKQPRHALARTRKGATQ